MVICESVIKNTLLFKIAIYKRAVLMKSSSNPISRLLNPMRRFWTAKSTPDYLPIRGLGSPGSREIQLEFDFRQPTHAASRMMAERSAWLAH